MAKIKKTIDRLHQFELTHPKSKKAISVIYWFIIYALRIAVIVFVIGMIYSIFYQNEICC